VSGTARGIGPPLFASKPAPAGFASGAGVRSCRCICFPRKNPELLFPSIANIRTNAVQFALANPDDGFIDFPDKDLPAMSINMTILLTLIVSFSIALAGVVHI
jgi:hypothetical protein